MIPTMEVWPSNRSLASPSTVAATLELYYAVPPAPLPNNHTTLPPLQQATFQHDFDSDSSLTDLESADSERSDSDDVCPADCGTSRLVFGESLELKFPS